MTPLPITCPKCGTNPGEPCRTINGHVTTVHTARLRLALEERRASA